MGVFLNRLVFLAFIGLTGFIVYNALYLQEQRSAALMPSAPPSAALAVTPEAVAQPSADPAKQADGTLSLQTRKAIADFEKDHGLPPTGKPSDELLRHILLGDADPGAASTGAVTVASNSGNDTKQSPPVKADATIQHVQQILADLGYAPGPVDGAMGTETERAVSAFQRDRKIAATGTITPELLREIKLVTGRELASETSTR
jgi:peptidoglycan hydrolase-like protein with peptidoglycan-binding domain